MSLTSATDVQAVFIEADTDALDADSISQSQTPSGAGNLTINGAKASGGVATFDSARQVTITSAGNDSARTFTVTPGPANFTVYTETLLNSPGQPAVGAPWPTLLSPGVAQVTISNLEGAGDLSSSPEFLTVGWSGDPTPEPKFSVTGDDAIYAPGPTPTPDEYNGPFTPDIVNVTIGKSPAVGPFVSPGMTPNPVGNPAPSWKIKFRLNLLRN